MVAVPEIHKVYPPAALLEDCLEPELGGDTYRDLAMLAVRQRAALEKCNVDKRLLREWKATEATDE